MKDSVASAFIVCFASYSVRGLIVITGSVFVDFGFDFYSELFSKCCGCVPEVCYCYVEETKKHSADMENVSHSRSGSTFFIEKIAREEFG